MNASSKPSQADSPAAWRRLSIAVAIGTIGGVGMWSVPVALPAVQADFAVPRGDASLLFTFTMLGFAFGGVAMGRIADRFGIVLPLVGGMLVLALGYVAAGHATSLWQLMLAQGLLIGPGCASTFGPLMADTSHWFVRRRGIAVSICAAGNYIAGAIWPPLLQHFIAGQGWRPTHIGVGIFCALTVIPLALLLRKRAPHTDVAAVTPPPRHGALGISPNTLQVLLCIAGIGCCVAMSMPQVHIVAYCGDLGYGVARGAEMLALMLAFGTVSRVASGFIADRIGGLRTLLLGVSLQAFALVLYMLFDGLFSLYVISALFGLFQGGIVPSYAIIVREYFPPQEAGTRVGLCIMATLVGMALGGWMSGWIFDLTGSYQAAFANGIGFGLLNIVIVLWLLWWPRQRVAVA